MDIFNLRLASIHSSYSITVSGLPCLKSKYSLVWWLSYSRVGGIASSLKTNGYGTDTPSLTNAQPGWLRKLFTLPSYQVGEGWLCSYCGYIYSQTWVVVCSPYCSSATDSGLPMLAEPYFIIYCHTYSIEWLANIGMTDGSDTGFSPVLWVLHSFSSGFVISGVCMCLHAYYIKGFNNQMHWHWRECLDSGWRRCTSVLRVFEHHILYACYFKWLFDWYMARHCKVPIMRMTGYRHGFNFIRNPVLLCNGLTLHLCLGKG